MRDDFYEYDETFLPQSTLREIAEQLVTPFYLYDERGIRNQIRRLREAFRWNDQYCQYFPIRLLPRRDILKIFLDEEIGVRCCTPAELCLAQQSGFSGKKILYAPMVLQDAEYQLLLDLGAALMVDNLETVNFCRQRGTFPATIGLRYHPTEKLAHTWHTFAKTDRSQLGMTREEILRIAPQLTAQYGVKELGLGAELLQQTMEPGYYGALAEELLQLSQTLQQNGVTVRFCDLGDGLGLGFLPAEENADPIPFGASAQHAFGSCPGDGRMTMAVWTGVGRWITGPCGIFVSQILGVKHLDRRYLILDAAVTQFPRALQGAYHHVSILGKTETAGRAYFDIVGYLPDLSQRFAQKRILPMAVAGDYCIIHDAGFAAGAMRMEYGGLQNCGEYLYTESGQICKVY